MYQLIFSRTNQKIEDRMPDCRHGVKGDLCVAANKDGLPPLVLFELSSVLIMDDGQCADQTGWHGRGGQLSFPVVYRSYSVL